MVNYACVFSQSESVKYFEWIITRFIIRWKFFFLFIGWEPTTGLAKLPPNNGLIMRDGRPTVFGCKYYFASWVNETTLFSHALAWKCEIASLTFQKAIFVKKQTRWPNDKTVIELGYRKISWYVSVSQINYLAQPSECSPLTNYDISLNLVQ